MMATVAAMSAASAATLVQPRRVGSYHVGNSRLGRSGVPTMSNRLVGARCMAEPNKNSESSSRPADGVQPIGPSSTTPPPLSTPVPKRKVSTSFEDVFSFSGPAPEIINGRLAMLGFVAALGAELRTGDGILTQIGNGGIAWFVVATSVITYASLVPMFRGISPASRENHIFTANAEIWNGRAAMIGVVALAITEYLTGQPLI
ncbi:hypothetical protein MPTK1_6g14540 [Marchantia polymorpha subsp. ruderalis]|uniref:Uncharacterized protein n=2 Tax=Marchantia polymorpha TaxID=3197 RepID=A0A176WP86_MARPO|nr:hypothetical protein AXG93_2891s1160 [Marchantia polymorpha subsp. ruderalis]PTQ39136.1 hypothetical protein MARPO_0047s0108 [Marchantia polymorpha]BBN14792.1 hypothetical protein Mp_6g14540 [Marchantia polymorpha subsp. ruderalis]|eukprot:PTQ39136.1 hypothetical protein MARPO_0047s0108 [Marchantia polymorpha]